MTVDWPVKAAESALLLWGKDKRKCKVVFDAAHRYLRIVDATDSVDDNVVYDTIDVDDMIGADISIDYTNAAAAASGVRAARAAAAAASNEPSVDAVVVDTQASAKLTLHVYPRRDPASLTLFHKCRLTSYQPVPTPNYARPADFSAHGPRLAHPRVLTLAPAEDLGAARALLAALQQVATRRSTSETSPPPPHYLVLCNPRSGPAQNADRIAESLVLPMLQQAGVETTLCVTTHAGHAAERCHYLSSDATDIAHYQGLVIMGGDGTVHEVLNGIRTRPDATALLTKLLPLGVVGCGTANGLATSLSHAAAASETYGACTDAFWIAKGHTVAADLSTYSILQSDASVKQYTSFLTFSWGIIAEIDIESERIHWMGSSRFDVWAVVRVLLLRKYRAKLSYTTNTTDAVAAVSEPVPASWTTLEDDLVLFWASQVSHAGRTVHHSPRTRTADGALTLFLVRGSVSRYRLARILLALETGWHENMPGVEWIQCAAYRLEPSDLTHSFNDLDGEKVEPGPVQGTCRCGGKLHPYSLLIGTAN